MPALDSRATPTSALLFTSGQGSGVRPFAERRLPAPEEVRRARGVPSGFTLLEVLIAIAVLGIALLALLSLDHEDLQSVIRAQEISRAAMLAQTLMTQAELQRIPPPGTTSGNFEQLYPGRYRNFRWTRRVEPSPTFPDLRKVEIRVLYGPRFSRSFDLVEFLHDPRPRVLTPRGQAPQNPALQGAEPQAPLGGFGAPGPLGGPGGVQGGPLGMQGMQ
ncbi:MAG TPA: type II secretion system minor pseudopilin GspI [Candidatus Binataceae bacterium]|nr:type II secretion system minor pseudopilin GspI [Candidatus Binataceae bacterium]